MRRLLYLAAALMLLSCSGGDMLRSGDLIFVRSTDAGEGTMEAAISEATGTITHVAIADTSDGLWVIDATPRHGVRRRPLTEFLDGCSASDVLIVKRLADPLAADDPAGKASTFAGEPYDRAFMPGNGAMYCSELVYESYLTKEGKHIFSAAPMNFLGPDGNMPAYWEEWFAELGIPVQQDTPGTNPQDLSESPLLVTVDIKLR